MWPQPSNAQEFSSFSLLFKEEELQKMINISEDLMRDYGHLFDLTVVNDDLQETYEVLSAALNRMANEQQWVPVTWLQGH